MPYFVVIPPDATDEPTLWVGPLSTHAAARDLLWRLPAEFFNSPIIHLTTPAPEGLAPDDNRLVSDEGALWDALGHPGVDVDHRYGDSLLGRPYRPADDPAEVAWRAAHREVNGIVRCRQTPCAACGEVAS